MNISSPDAVSPVAVGKSLPLTALRLRERMDEMDLSQEELASAVDATQGAISQILTGLTRNSRLLPKIAAALAVNLDWLVGVTDDKIDMFDAEHQNISEDDLARMRTGRHFKQLLHPEQLGANKAADVRAAFKGPPPQGDRLLPAEKLVPVREIDLTLGMGGRYLDVPVTETVRHFSRDWIRQYTRASPEHLLFAQGVGDSMKPTLEDSDLLLIDCSQQTLNMADKIWAISYADCGSVKRLRPVPGGGVEIHSDNPAVPTATAYDGELHILGRVVAIVRKM